MWITCATHNKKWEENIIIAISCNVTQYKEQESPVRTLNSSADSVVIFVAFVMLDLVFEKFNTNCFLLCKALVCTAIIKSVQNVKHTAKVNFLILLLTFQEREKTNFLSKTCMDLRFIFKNSESMCFQKELLLGGSIFYRLYWIHSAQKQQKLVRI